MYVNKGNLLFKSKDESYPRQNTGEVPENISQNSFAENDVDVFISDVEGGGEQNLGSQRKSPSIALNKKSLSNSTNKKSANTQKEDVVAKFGLDESKIRLLAKVQKLMRAYLSRNNHVLLNKKNYKVVFARCFRQEKHTLLVRIMERVYKLQSGKPAKAVIVAYDLTDKATFNVLTYGHGNLKAIEPFKIDLPKLRETIQFDVKMHYMDYKNQIFSHSYSSGDDEDAAMKERESLDLPDLESEGVDNQLAEDGDDEYDQSPGIRQNTNEGYDNSVEVTEFLTTVPIIFEDDIEFTGSVYYNLRHKEICIEARSSEFQTQVLRVSLKEMGLLAFNKQNFIKNIEKLLLVNLFIEDGKLTFEAEKPLLGRIETVEEEAFSPNRNLRIPFDIAYQTIETVQRTDRSFNMEREFLKERSFSKDISMKVRKNIINIPTKKGSGNNQNPIQTIESDLKDDTQLTDADKKAQNEKTEDVNLEGENLQNEKSRSQEAKSYNTDVIMQKESSMHGDRTHGRLEKSNQTSSNEEEEKGEEPNNGSTIRETKLQFGEDPNPLPNKDQGHGQYGRQIFKKPEPLKITPIKSEPLFLKNKGAENALKENTDKKLKETSEVENVLKELSSSSGDDAGEGIGIQEKSKTDQDDPANQQQNEIQMIVSELARQNDDPTQSRRNSRKSQVIGQFDAESKQFNFQPEAGSNPRLIDFIDPEAQKPISPIKFGHQERETAYLKQDLIEESEINKPLKQTKIHNRWSQPLKKSVAEPKNHGDEYQLVINGEKQNRSPKIDEEDDALIYLNESEELRSQASRVGSQRHSVISQKSKQSQKLVEEDKNGNFKEEQPAHFNMFMGGDQLNAKDPTYAQKNQGNKKPRSLIF